MSQLEYQIKKLLVLLYNTDIIKYYFVLPKLWQKTTFKEKYKIMAYHKYCKVKAEHNYNSVSTCKISTISALKITITEQHSLLNTVLFSSRIMFIGWRLIVLDPGGDDSSSGGGSDLEAAQNSLEVWACTGQG